MTDARSHSQKCIDFLKLWEGRDLVAYDDATGKQIRTTADRILGTLTIGYGHTDAAGPPRVYPGMAWSDPYALRVLGSDLTSVDAEVDHYVKFDDAITQDMIDALVAFQFNTGRLQMSSLLKTVNATPKDLITIQRDFGMWVDTHVGGRLVVDPGLVNRRHAEFVLYSTGEILSP